ncbi:Tfp pilus assembly protein FimV, partial [Pseudomonas amygdali pv. lachrymans]
MACSTLASALGLGEITLHSALNQPLNAEIQLLETGGLSNEDVVARLASPEAFAKAGIERVFFLNDLRFTPVLRGDRGVIRVVSTKPVTEPYLSFLVQLARPNGDLLHEYTVLLDPATSPQGLAATRSRNTQRSTASAQESRMPVAPPAAVQGKHYTVANGDTLNGIASRLQGPGNKVSASQLADGIRLLNPQAFAAGAGSALKVGQDLLLPDSAILPSAAAPAASPEASSPKPAELQRTA